MGLSCGCCRPAPPPGIRCAYGVTLYCSSIGPVLVLYWWAHIRLLLHLSFLWFWALRAPSCAHPCASRHRPNPTGTDNSISALGPHPETWQVASASKSVLTVQVRELVEFALRQGDLGGPRDFVGPNRALAGTRGHQRLQRSRPAGYQTEVRIC